MILRQLISQVQGRKPCQLTRFWRRGSGYGSAHLQEAQIPDLQLSRPLKFAQLPASAVYHARYRQPCQLTRFAVLHQLQRSTIIPRQGQGGGQGQGGAGGRGRLISCKTLTAPRRPTPSDNIHSSRAGTWTTVIPDAFTSEPVSCRNRRI